MHVKTAPTQQPVGWIYNAQFDLLFIVGISLLALVSGAIVVVEPSLFVPILLMDLWLLGYHHVISTYTRLCFDNKSIRENRFFLFGLPPLVFGSVFVLAYSFGFWIIATIYLYWQWFHYTRQSWGVQQAYRGKSGGCVRENQWLVKSMFYLLPLWGILHRSAQQPEEFIGMEIWVIPVPLLLVDIVAVAAVATILAWTWQRVQSFRKGHGAPAHTLYMVSHIVIFYVGYIFIEDITFGWLVINIWHNAQYVLFVWMYNNRKFRDGITDESPLLSRLAQSGNWIYYFGFCFLVTTVVYVLINKFTDQVELIAVPLALVVYQTINFHHYIVDSFIWKLKKPAIKKDLGLSA